MRTFAADFRYLTLTVLISQPTLTQRPKHWKWFLLPDADCADNPAHINPVSEALEVVKLHTDPIRTPLGADFRYLTLTVLITQPPSIQHWKHYRRFPLPDVDSADISAYFNPTFEAIEEARLKGYAVLVHCGAGVSRSATLVMMYLMRHHLWSAARAKDLTQERRSLVCPNAGFWRSLCALESGIGISQRSDPDAMGLAADEDAPPLQLSKDAAGVKVEVKMLSKNEMKRRQEEEEREGGGDAKRQRTEGGGKLFVVTFAVVKAKELVGYMETKELVGYMETEGGGKLFAVTFAVVKAFSVVKAKELVGYMETEGAGKLFAVTFAIVKAFSVVKAKELVGYMETEGGGKLFAVTFAVVKAFSVVKAKELVGYMEIGPMSFSQRVVFGRSPDSDVVLEHLSISRSHGQLTIDTSGTAFITDMQSGHGTKLDDTWIRPQAAKQLRRGSLLSFGASSRSYKLHGVKPA
eukprot:gene19181-25795_t